MADSKTNFTIRGEFCIETRPLPCGVVIFGASGDLTGRKLIPALFQLHRRKLLPKSFYIFGFARSAGDDEGFRYRLQDELFRHLSRPSISEINAFLQMCHYEQRDYENPGAYGDLAQRLADLDSTHGTGGNRLFYLATPPKLYADICANLGGAGLLREAEGGGFARVIVEKPFGHDLTSALELDRRLHEIMAEGQIYRIDHYLGKETVQNILMFRFANAIFEPVWNRRYIDHVQITVAESVGVEHRAGYFEQAGIVRDMFQNHMLQMLALVAMEPPASFEADRVRDEKVKLLRSIRPLEGDAVDGAIVRGQYAGYRQEPGVAAESITETFAAARLRIDNWRWQGVPFYLRSGKRLARRASEIAIQFKPVPHSMFSPIGPEELAPNILLLRVQPDEGIALVMQAKHPGPKLCMSSLEMDFRYSEVFEEEAGDAYERLLLDAMLGDQTLFVRSDDMAVAWALITPVLERWAAQGAQGELHAYDPGSWGPAAADQLIQADSRRWHNP